MSKGKMALSAKDAQKLHYTPIAFDERETSKHLVTALCMRVCCMYARAIAKWLFTSLHANNATYAHAQGSDQTH